MHLAVYAGTFDPITFGHIDVIRRALRCCDRLIIGVAGSTTKTTLFSLEERKALVSEAIAEYADRVEIDTFDGLLVDYVRNKGAVAIIRGLRAFTDSADVPGLPSTYCRIHSESQRCMSARSLKEPTLSRTMHFR